MIFVVVAVWFVLVWGVIIVNHARQRDLARFDELRSRGEPIVGAARVGWWNMTIPLAVILITDDAVFVGGRWRYLPGAAAVVHRDDLVRMESKPGLTGTQLKIERRDGKRIWFAGPDVAEQLRAHGWPVEQRR